MCGRILSLQSSSFSPVFLSTEEQFAYCAHASVLVAVRDGEPIALPSCQQHSGKDITVGGQKLRQPPRWVQCGPGVGREQTEALRVHGCMLTRVCVNALPSSGQKHSRAWDFLAAAEYFL